MQLNPQQQQILERFTETDDNILLLGEAGTGKSVLLTEIVSHLNNKNANYWLTATTGTAAENIQGQTMHRQLGIIVEPGSEPNFEKICQKIQQRHLDQWQKVDVWILDEVSMLSGTLFDKLEQVARFVRRNEKPFGGIRLVFCGDVLQLGPVKASRLFFEAECYESCFGNREFVLTLNMRQKESDWLEMLRRIRVAKHTAEDLKKLSMNAVDEKLVAADSDILRLYCRNEDVDKINNDRLQKLIAQGNESKVFRCIIESDLPSEATKHLRKADLTVCLGAKVMHTRNISPLVNGSRGTVTSIKPLIVKFEGKGKVEIVPCVTTVFVRKGNRKHLVKVTCTPLVLAWAITVHKAQSKTITTGLVDLGRVFSPSQIYVAISRFSSLEGLGLLGFDPSKIWCEKKCVEYLDRIMNR